MHSKRQYALPIGLSLCLAALFGFIGLQHFQNGAIKDSGLALADFTEQVARGHVVFYEHTSYQGQQTDVGLDGPWIVDLGNTPLGDATSSIKVGAGIKVKMCDNWACQDQDWWQTIEMVGPYNVGELVADEADRISYVQIEPYDEKTNPLVSIYEEQDMNAGNVGVLGVGQYNHNALRWQGHVQNVKGFHIPAGLYIKIYQGDNFLGDSTIIQGPKRINFARESGWESWKDNVHSLEISKQDRLAVTCSWVQKGITNGHHLKSTKSVGYSKTSGSSTETSIANSFSQAVEAGYEFSGFSTKVTLTTSQSYEIRQATSESLTHEMSESLEVTCDNPEGGWISVYQFKMEGTRGTQIETEVLSEIYVCRKGSLAFSPPKCPFNLCDPNDNQCEKCQSSFSYVM